MGSRLYAQKEWRLLSWWLATYHPGADIYMNVHVGPRLRLSGETGDVALDRATAVMRNRWADAIYVERGEPHIVEAKLAADPGIYSKLIHYARRFRADPQWREYEHRPLWLEAVVYDEDLAVMEEAPWYGVQWISYHPDLDGLPPPALRANGLDVLGNPPQLPADWVSRLRAWGVAALSE